MFKKIIREYKAVAQLIILAIFSGITIMPARAGINDQKPATEDFYELVSINTDRDFYIAGERVYFKVNVRSIDNSPVSSIVYLILRNRSNSIIESSAVLINKNTGFGSIYLPDTLSSSVFQIVAFTNWMRNFREEIYAEKQIRIINRFDEQLNISNPANTGISHEECQASQYGSNTIGLKLSGTIFRPREKVRIEITPPVTGLIESVAVSVTQKETLNSSRPVVDFQFPGYYRKAHIGNKIKFLKETNGPIITGKLIDKQTREGISGANVLLTTADSVVNLLYATTLHDGAFHFELNDYYEGKDLYFSVFDEDIAGRAEITIIEKFMLSNPFVPDYEPAGMVPAEFVKTSQDIVRTNKTLEIDLVENIEPVRSGYSTDVYSSPAFSFGLFKEYEYLDNLHEIARELIPYLRIRRNEGIYSSNIVLEYSNYFSPEPPVYFLDGIYTDDINQIIHLNSDDLDRLDVHHYRWRHGELFFPGIVAIFSNNESYRNLKLSEPSVVYRHHPAAIRTVYTPPDYGKDKILRSKPDFRQLLFWDPEITFDSIGKGKIIEFFTGDIPGEFFITATGYSDEGEAVTSKSSFVVNNMDNMQGTENLDTTSSGTVTEGSVLNTSVSVPGNFQNSETDTVHMENYFEQGLSGMMTAQSKKLIGDQNYPSQDWLPGTVVLDHDIKISKKFLKYNGYLDELYWLYEEDFQQIQLDRKLIREFHLTPPWSDNTFIFRRIDVHSPLFIGKSEIFGQLLYEGDISLYAYRRVIGTNLGNIRENGRLIGGTVIKPSHLYVFVMPDGTTRVTKKIRRGKIASLFPEHRKEIRRMLRQNRVRSGNERGLTETTRLINEYMMGISNE